MAGMCLGFDTSNYTTSAAVFDGRVGVNHGRLLTVLTGFRLLGFRLPLRFLRPPRVW